MSFSAALLAACGSTPDDTGPVASPPRDQPAPPAYTPVPYHPEPSTPAPVAPEFKPVTGDSCGAHELQWLVGKPRTDIPVPLNPGKRRVVCSTCVITMDYSADRQTIVFDTDTGLIQSVKCG
ncbi:MAG: proteinase inhibitor i78 [Asticcacaulis sp.]|nr:proteinase inhibitor i78 [Asticcacaulis sp.]